MIDYSTTHAGSGNAGKGNRAHRSGAAAAAAAGADARATGDEKDQRTAHTKPTPLSPLPGSAATRAGARHRPPSLAVVVLCYGHHSRIIGIMFISASLLVLFATYQLGLFLRGADTRPDVPSWHQYVRAPPSTFVKPKRVLTERTSGGVANPDGLVSGVEPTILHRHDKSDEIPTLVADFGQNVVGLPVIDFAGSSGAPKGRRPGIRLYFSESLEFLGDRSDFTRSDNAGDEPPKIVPSGTDQIAVKSGSYTWIGQWGCEFEEKVCADGLHGFRYLKITLDALPEDSPHTSGFGEVSISSIGLRWSGYHGTPDTFSGWFECSDKNLTQWWYDGSYTNEMCTDVFRANDTEPRQGFSDSLRGKLVIHDGPKRDRDPYMGDLAVAGLTSYLTHDVHEAARNVMEDLAEHQRDDGWIPPASIRDYSLKLFDFPLWWVSCSWDHVMYTGNLSYIKSYYPTLLSVLDTYYVRHTDNATSLLLRQEGYGDYAFIPRDGSAAYYSALYVLALNRAADLAGYLDKSEDATRWRKRATAVSEGFLNTLWDPKAGAFLDRKCDGDGCRAHAQDGNSLAILSGIANGSRAESALRYLSDTNARPYGNTFYDADGAALGDGFADRVYPFISYFEIAARFRTGGGAAATSASAFDQIRRTWGWMASRDPGSTFWEGVGAGGARYEAGFTSLAHGWSTGVTPLLTTYVLGARPVAPGFTEWDVRPVPGDLAWARGVVPTPRGPLQVSWERLDSGEGDDGDGPLEVTVRAPADTKGTISVPVAEGDDDGAEALLDGVAGKGRVVGDGYIAFEVWGGEEHVVGYPQY